ncbi:MAG: hypothetical protein P1V35_12515 [Planctomycetota bacterium]|nr:hypothetical protein [Planctomycetota bacterium]
MNHFRIGLVALVACFAQESATGQCFDWSDHSLSASNGDQQDDFGYAVEAMDDWVFVGAPRADHALGTGRTYVYRNQGGVWSEAGELQTQLPAAGFGFSMHVAGNTLFVSEPGHTFGSGRVRVFELQGGAWVFTESISSVPSAHDEWFGEVMHAQGDWAIFGTRAGGVDTFHHNGSYWEHAGVLNPFGSSSGTGFGASVAIQNGVAYVGAPEDSTPTGPSQAGAIFTFQRVDGVWQEGQVLRQDNPNVTDHFGSGFSIDGDRVAVTGFDNFPRRNWILQHDGTDWQQEVELNHPLLPAEGWEGSIQLQGGLLAIGYPRSNGRYLNTGIIVLFEESPLGWIYRSSQVGVGVTGSGGRLGWDFEFMGQGLVGGAHRQNQATGVARIFDLDETDNEAYCPGPSNSMFPGGATVRHLGSASLASNQLVLTVEESTPFEMGVLVYSAGQGSIPFGNGTLCVGEPWAYLGGALVADRAGSASQVFEFRPTPSATGSGPWTNMATQHFFSPGDRLNFQWLYRDGDAGGTGLLTSSAYSMLICP